MFIIEGQQFFQTRLHSEEDFEQLLIQLQSDVFPNFFLFETKKVGITPAGEKTHADLCMISKTCEQCFVIEVELQKGDYYAKSHIREQLSKQVQADWESLVNEMQDKLKKLKIPRNIYSRLGKVDWGNMLIIDEASEAVDRICSEFGVTMVEIQTLMSHRDYALNIKNPKQIPEFLGEESINVIPSKDIQCVAGTLYVPLTPVILEKIYENEKRCKLIVESEILSLALNLRDELEIPVSRKGTSITAKISRKTIDVGIELGFEDDELVLRLHEVDNWGST
jgi:hypothetical protein